MSLDPSMLEGALAGCSADDLRELAEMADCLLPIAQASDGWGPVPAAWLVAVRETLGRLAAGADGQVQ